MTPLLCPSKNTCEESPLANLTAETPDVPVFTSVFFPTLNPPLNKTFSAQGCVSLCTSNVSQEEANLCAARQAAQCGGGNGNPPPPPPPICVEPAGCVFVPPGGGGGGGGGGVVVPPPGSGITVCNTVQSCCVQCPDGTEFCYTVPACTFLAGSIAEANAIAQSYACKQAGLKRICILGSPRNACIGTGYVIVFTEGFSQFAPFTWSIVAGSLPPGLSGATAPDTTKDFIISGNLTTSGDFPFTLRVTDTAGNYMQKTFSISVIEITTTTLPDAQIGVPYSVQLNAVGGVPPYNWVMQLNAVLPDGLTLSSTGIISGTPTGGSGSFNFDVCVGDSTGNP